MSYVHFDEMLEIILGFMQEQSAYVDEKPPEKQSVPEFAEEQWRKEALMEIQWEKEELYV